MKFPSQKCFYFGKWNKEMSDKRGSENFLFTDVAQGNAILGEGQQAVPLASALSADNEAIM